MSSEGPCPGLHKIWGQNYAGVCGLSLDKPLGSPFLRTGLRKEPRLILRDLRCLEGLTQKWGHKVL